MTSLLGLDSGLTVTKAVLFDEDGRELAVARRRVPQSMPRPRHVERDMDGLWAATAAAIAETIDRSGRPAGDIAVVAATAHGDGLYLVDAGLRPLGPGILSLDSRASAIAADWTGNPAVSAQALDLTGQLPHASSPAALLAWIAREEPERLSRVGHVLSCKDWLRLCLTGAVGTDRTEASTAFTNVRTQDYDPRALELYGLSALALAPALPAIAASADIVGHVTNEAAARTGLVAGTPVAAGLHDVTASALGTGGHRKGTADVVAGTYSINQIVSDHPRTDARWFCRNGIAPGTWNSMSISPASTANYDWFIETFCAGTHRGGDIHDELAAEVRGALDRPSTLVFHPFLFGAPHGPHPSGGFIGLHGWHARGDMLRAVLEGIAFNHCHHVNALSDGFSFDAVRLSGGVSRNSDCAQMMADVLALPVTVSSTGEAAAWGAALCAGAAAGIFETPFDDPRDLGAISRTHWPDEARHAAHEKRRAVYEKAITALQPLWPDLEALAETEVLS